MVSLTQNSNGAYQARKRLPGDVQEEYGRLYGQRVEARFFAPASTKSHEAKQRFREWEAEVEARIAAIRAERSGEGVALTHRQTRALAGEWYDWFIARHPLSEREKWEHLRDKIHEGMREAVGDEVWETNDPDELWREDESFREEVRPLLADAGETSQFLAMKSLALDKATRDMFLDFLYEDLAAALKRLMQQADGRYPPDRYREQFPKFEGVDSGETPLQLFNRWVIEKRPTYHTRSTWSYVFEAMAAYFEGRSAASITADEAQDWIKGLVSGSRSAATVRRTWISASKAVFSWAVEHRYLTRNPFKDVKVTVPRKRKNRETQGFTKEEWRTILTASNAITDTIKPLNAAKRWVPWLLAYTGARPSEITQLRKRDVVNRDGIDAILITPDAGSTKSGTARTVPLHEDLIARGFLKFVEKHRDGPLFYSPDSKANADNSKEQKKPRSAQTSQRLASWIRTLGVTDEELRPNHAWRHTFKQRADRAGISERMSDSITGHAHKSVGAAYGEPTLEDKAAALKKFPRYVLGD